MIRIQPAGLKDLPKIHSLELKSFEYPLEHKALQDIFETRGAIPLLGTLTGFGVGWGLGQYHKDEAELEIRRLCIHPAYRRQGFARMMVGHMWNEAVKRECVKVFFMVPEYRFDADESEPLTGFFEHLNFNVAGVERDYFYRYGRTYDGFRLEREA